MVKIAIFDLDDTLYDNYGVLFPKAIRLVAKALVEAGVAMEEEALYELIVKTYPSYHVKISKSMEKVLTEAGVDKSKHEELIKLSGNAYGAITAEGITIDPAVVEMLKRLREKYTLALMTMGSTRLQNDKIDTLGIRGLFDFIDIVDNGQGTKEKAMKQFLQQNGFSHNDAVYIGDRPDNDIESANKAGMKTIRLMKWKYEKCEPANEMQKADVTVSDPLDVEKALETL